jgi:hypothetical protein
MRRRNFLMSWVTVSYWSALSCHCRMGQGKQLTVRGQGAARAATETQISECWHCARQIHTDPIQNCVRLIAETDCEIHIEGLRSEPRHLERSKDWAIMNNISELQKQNVKIHNFKWMMTCTPAEIRNQDYWANGRPEWTNKRSNYLTVSRWRW